MNIIFCGTPQFAVPTLEILTDQKFVVELVVTNPDEPSGRGYEPKPSPIKKAAEKRGLKVFQPARLKAPETRGFLSTFHPDAIVVVAYGHIIPSWMIELPRLGCINLHASLLPKYRGAAPIPWALIRGERKTGVTTMKIDPGLDTGDILLQKEIEIREDDTTESVSERLSLLGAQLMVETLRGLDSNEIRPRPQDHLAATLAPMLKKEDGRLDWLLSAEEIARRVRGLRPWPVAYTSFRGKKLQLWTARLTAQRAPSDAQPGTLVVESGRLWVVCGDGLLLGLTELQLEGRRRVSARDFVNGIRLKPGEKVE